MSRSRRVPIYKDGGIASHKLYRRKLRHRINQAVRDIKCLIDIETYELPAPRTIVCDWDWCDYVLDYREWNTSHPVCVNHWENLDEFREYMKNLYLKASRK